MFCSSDLVSYPWTVNHQSCLCTTEVTGPPPNFHFRLMSPVIGFSRWGVLLLKILTVTKWRAGRNFPLPLIAASGWEGRRKSFSEQRPNACPQRFDRGPWRQNFPLILSLCLNVWPRDTLKLKNPTKHPGQHVLSIHFLFLRLERKMLTPGQALMYRTSFSVSKELNCHKGTKNWKVIYYLRTRAERRFLQHVK